MRCGVIARKLGMSRIFNDKGEHVPVTVLRLEDVEVLSTRSIKKNGYVAVQLGFNNKKVKDDFGAQIIVKSCNIEYKISAHLEDELTIRSFVKSITKTSFFMSQFIKRGEDLIVEAKVHLVFVNKEGKPIKIPGTLFHDFKPYFCDTIKT